MFEDCKGVPLTEGDTVIIHARVCRLVTVSGQNMNLQILDPADCKEVTPTITLNTRLCERVASAATTPTTEAVA